MVHKGWRVKVRCARVCVHAGVWSPWQDAANEKNSKAAGKVNLKKHARHTYIWIHWCVRVCVRFHFISFFCCCCSARIPFAGSYKTFPTFTLISTVASTWAHMICLSLFPLSRSLSPYEPRLFWHYAYYPKLLKTFLSLHDYCYSRAN